MGQGFPRPVLDVESESGCYSCKRGCFSEILRNLASFSSDFIYRCANAKIVNKK